MGLLDVLNGMQNGPRGQTDPNAKGGMSPVTMAVLALLAYKGLKHMSGGQAPAPGTTPGRAPAGGATADGGGGLGGLLGGLLGGGGGAGGAGGGLAGGLPGGLPGGLGDLLKGLGGGAGGAVVGFRVDLGICSRAWVVAARAADWPAAGGLLAGGAGGSILSGGLDSLVKQLQQNGQGAAAKSWVGNGPNQDISPGDLAKPSASTTSTPSRSRPA